jgi:peptide/nickel transport system ATP-binding protein
MPSIRMSPEPQGAAPVLALEHLSVSFATPQGPVHAVRDVSFAIARGECVAVVGESGAGKSQLFLALLGLAGARAVTSGSARFAGRELIGAAPQVLARVRGAGIGLILQDPLTALTPHLTVGAQLEEVIVRHARLSGAPARQRALELLERVHLNAARTRLRQYPHELSGGMRQRVLIALALAGDPRLLIADEPTTALDVTIQAQILALLLELRLSAGLTLVLITHDLAAVAGLAGRVLVLKDGRLIESGTVAQVLKSPHDPYTQHLVRTARALQEPSEVPPAAPSGAVPALALTDVSVTYTLSGAGLRRARLRALTQAGFELAAGDSLGIVGESGCGKSTLARAALMLLKPHTGRIVWLGRDLAGLPAATVRTLRHEVQLVFQDPLGSLDPRLTVAEILAEPLAIHGGDGGPERGRRVAAALAEVGLGPELLERYAHQLSGGQCQRVGIARAMILRPQVLVCDEPVSSLDAPTQEQIVRLLEELRRKSGLALIFISHNLPLVRRLCARVLVLYLGRMMELADSESLYQRPGHPYSRELLAAAPSADPDLEPQRLQAVQGGEPASPLQPPSGCVYRTRCRYALALCAEAVPLWERTGSGRWLACRRWQELPRD